MPLPRHTAWEQLGRTRSAEQTVSEPAALLLPESWELCHSIRASFLPGALTLLWGEQSYRGWTNASINVFKTIYSDEASLAI